MPESAAWSAKPSLLHPVRSNTSSAGHLLTCLIGGILAPADPVGVAGLPMTAVMDDDGGIGHGKATT